MKEVTKTVYVADDGSEFDTPEKCERHELAGQIASTLRTHPDLEWYSDAPDTEDIAHILLDNYLIVPPAKVEVASQMLNRARGHHRGLSSATYVEITEAMRTLGLPT